MSQYKKPVVEIKEDETLYTISFKIKRALRQAEAPEEIINQFINESERNTEEFLRACFKYVNIKIKE
jgi:hypothetical protein